jgi:hypothetical protein
MRARSRFNLFLAITLSIALCSCSDETVPEPIMQLNSDEVQIFASFSQGDKSLDHAVYTIGEPIDLDIGINNSGNGRLAIGNFSAPPLYYFTFPKTFTFHLIAPDGQDLLLPYLQGAEQELPPPLYIEPHGQLAFRIQLSWYLHLRELGEYRFWIELKDDQGTVIQSNRITFQLVNVESNISSSLIELTLDPSRPSFKFKDRLDMEITFANHTEIPLTFLKPHTWSFYGWINPIYEFTVSDELGRGLAIPQTDISESPPDYSDSTLRFTIPPEDSYGLSVHLPRYDAFQNPGIYRVRLAYIVRRNTLLWGVPTEELLNWSSDVFIGRIESNEIFITIE